jgi:hypothetical protein
MADRKISDLTALTTPASGDFLPIVDISEAAAATKNKRITIQSLLQGIPVNVGIGTSSPQSPLHVIGTEGLRVESAASSEGFIRFVNTSGSMSIGMGGAVGNNLLIFDRTNNQSAYTYIGGAGGYHAWSTNNTERLRIDSSGRLLVGTSSARLISSTFLGGGGAIAELQVEGTALAMGSFASNRNDGFGPYLALVKSRGTAAGSFTLVSNGDGIGALSFNGTDGSAAVVGAAISAFVDGTPGANDMPGRLVFSTTADGGSSPTERMRIDSSGRLLVGTSTSTTSGAGFTPSIQVAGTVGLAAVSIGRYSADGFQPQLQLQKSRGGIGVQTIVSNNDALGDVSFEGSDGTVFKSAAAIRCEVDGTPGTNDMPGRLIFSTTSDGAATPTERMRIKSNGTINFSNVATYADNTAALAGGLVAGDVYRKSDGTLMITY